MPSASGADNAIALTCASPANWCAENTPTVGPHMTVTCDEAADTISIACEPGWIDANDDQSDGCELAYDAIPNTNEMAQAVAEYLYGGDRIVTVQPNCFEQRLSVASTVSRSTPTPTIQSSAVRVSGVFWASNRSQPLRPDR